MIDINYALSNIFLLYPTRANELAVRTINGRLWRGIFELCNLADRHGSTSQSLSLHFIYR